MTRKTTVILISIVSAILAVGVLVLIFGLRSGGNMNSAKSDGTTPVIEVEVLTQGDSIEISGNIEPSDSVDLAFPKAGYIDSVQVQVGDKVRTGQVVAILEDSQQRYDLAAVDVSIDTEIVSGTQRNLTLLKLKRDLMAGDLEDTRLKSTIEGVVTEVNVTKGDWVTAQQAGSAKDIVVRVIDRSTMIATVEVDELDAPLLNIDQLVNFQFDAYPDLKITGKVTRIPLEAKTTTQGIAVLETEVTIFNPPAEFFPFFTFAGEIILSADSEVLMLPSAAVITRGDRSMVLKVVSVSEAESARSGQGRPSGGGDTGSGAPGTGRPGMAPFGDLVLPEGMAVLPTTVTVEAAEAGKVVVTSGLSAGDRVAIPGSTSVTTGAADASVDETKKSANVLELLGMPSRGGGGDGGPPPDGPPRDGPAQSGPPPGGRN